MVWRERPRPRALIAVPLMYVFGRAAEGKMPSGQPAGRRRYKTRSARAGAPPLRGRFCLLTSFGDSDFFCPRTFRTLSHWASPRW